MLIIVEMPTIVGILTFIGRIKMMLSCVEHEKALQPEPFNGPTLNAGLVAL